MVRTKVIKVSLPSHMEGRWIVNTGLSRSKEAFHASDEIRRVCGHISSHFFKIWTKTGFLILFSKGRYSKINVYLPSNTHYSYFLFVFAPIKGSLM